MAYCCLRLSKAGGCGAKAAKASGSRRLRVAEESARLRCARLTKQTRLQKHKQSTNHDVTVATKLRTIDYLIYFNTIIQVRVSNVF